jgi:hypothetical protein
MANLRRATLTLLTAGSLALAFAGAGTIGAAADGIQYQFVTGAGALCSLTPTACPDVARASNGDTIEIAGQGTFVTGSDEVGGGGTFVHRDAAGNVKARGTWTAEELLSFTSFGGNAPGLPPNFEGGLARIEVELHPNGSHKRLVAVLQVDCGINSPTGAEGVKLAVRHALTFSQEVSGLTIFINHGPAEGD